jgi:hypothetical protein
MSEHWKIAVNREACLGSGVCAATAPSHFRLDPIVVTLGSSAYPGGPVDCGGFLGFGNDFAIGIKLINDVEDSPMSIGAE